MELGKLGVWFFLDALDGEASARFAQKCEKLGYSALWIPEAAGREPFAHAGFLLSRTEKLIIATGIANIWGRDALAMMSGARTCAELSGGRFILGIGVSHAPLVMKLRGHDFSKPYSYMKEYLPKLKAAAYQSVRPKEEPPIVLAALHPKMQALAAAETRGTHTYFVTPEHTAKTRAAMGPDAWICAEQAVMLETDPAKARAAARPYMKTYVPRLPNYKNNLLNLGWKESDFENGCSDALVDAVIAWGSAEKIQERIDAHWKAGANHVCILPLRSDGAPQPCEKVIEALAPKKS